MKYLIGALIVANLLCFAWFNGWMAPLGGDGREPDRMNRQIEPQRLRIVPPYRLAPEPAAEPAASPTPAPAPAAMPAAPVTPVSPKPAPPAAAEPAPRATP